MSDQQSGESRKPRRKSVTTSKKRTASQSGENRPADSSTERRPKKRRVEKRSDDRDAAANSGGGRKSNTASSGASAEKGRGKRPARHRIKTASEAKSGGRTRRSSDDQSTASDSASTGERRRPKRDFRKGSANKQKAQGRRHQREEPKLPLKKRTIVPDGATVPFAELGLAEPVAAAIAETGYQFATPIQAAAIPAVFDGRDVLGSAQTGTGKTAAFTLPILSLMSQAPAKAVPHRPQVLMLAPTRELAAQILDSVSEYGRNLKFRTAVIFGGVGQGNQVRALERGVHILVATPGRLIDLMDQGYIDLSGLETFVLDEADRMLDMGFMPALQRIISELPEKRQSLFFSATISSDIKKLTKELLRDPVSIDVTPAERSVHLIEQTVQFVRKGDKPERLLEVLSEANVGQAVVFTRTKRGANSVAEHLDEFGIKAEAIHGNKSQNARTKTLNAFRVGRVQVLVATDVAARGLDIDDVTHVINYELPNEPESYVHRIGRTGRAGAQGTAIAFCDANEKDFLRDIEKLLKQKIEVVGEDEVGYAPPEPQGNRRAASKGGRRGSGGGRGPSGRGRSSRDGGPKQGRGDQGGGKRYGGGRPKARGASQSGRSSSRRSDS